MGEGYKILTEEFTPQELRLKKLLQVLAFLFALGIIGYLIPALTGPYQSFYINLPFVTNSVVKIGVLALLSWIASADVRKFSVLVIVVIAGHIISELATLSVLIWGNTGYDVSIDGTVIPIKTILYGSMILDGIIIIILFWFFLSAEKAKYKLLYLSPLQYRTLISLAEVLIDGKNEIIPAEKVARNIDNYLSDFTASSKWLMRLVLIFMQIYPLLTFKPPLSYLDCDSRKKFLKNRFYQKISLRLVPEFWRIIIQSMIRTSNQICYMGYYNDPAVNESIGYIPFSKRSDSEERIRKYPVQPRKPLYTKSEKDIVGDEISADVLIIGSGAGASILARGLIEKGRKVLMIEKGEHVDVSEFTENEMDMISKLYADGALQQAKDFRFTVFQGCCVGGSTVVNNAVCFDLPEDILNNWNDKQGFNANLNKDDIMASNKKGNDLLKVSRQTEYLSRGGDLFVEGCKKLGLDAPPNDLNSVIANIEGNLGTGYANIGGGTFGKKLSMLTKVLPEIQETFGKESLQIIAGCEALKLKTNGKRATSVICKFKSGRKIKVNGKTIVISAGAISSSLLLIKSGIATKNAGKNLSFNIGSPVTAFFDEPLNSYDGLQISHYLQFKPSRGYIFETWYNPPMFQSTAMPGWFEDHFRNMQRFNKTACIGVLVGSDSNAKVRNAGFIGREIDYTPTKKDFDTLMEGLELAGKIYLKAGANSVAFSTFNYREFTESDIDQLSNYVKDPSDISLGTGHPQGGNIISSDPEKGVVNPEFKVHGYDNLYIVDASVFPSSVGVNPQITVMTLADYASNFIALNN